VAAWSSPPNSVATASSSADRAPAARIAARFKLPAGADPGAQRGAGRPRRRARRPGASAPGSGRLAAAWAQVIGAAGDYQGMGEPVAHQVGDYTVVNVPLRFEAAELTGRVSYDRAGQVAGLYFLNEP
jgi:hypothetical protein